MSLIDTMATESITVRKQDGSTNGPYKATFSQNTMRIFGQEGVDVDDGDTVERPLPNGKVEVYVVEESIFVRGVSSMPDNWKMIVRKDTSLRRSGARTTNINIHNSQGIQVGDHNVQHVQSVIESLINAINDGEGTDEEKAEAKSRLQAFLGHPLVTSTLGAAAGALVKAAT